MLKSIKVCEFQSDSTGGLRGVGLGKASLLGDLSW